MIFFDKIKKQTIINTSLMKIKRITIIKLLSLLAAYFIILDLSDRIDYQNGIQT